MWLWVNMGHHRPSPSFRWFPAMRTACCEVTFWSCNLRQKMVVVELKCNWMTCHGPKMPRLNGHGPWNGAAWKVNSDFEMFSWKDQRLGTRMWWFDIHRKLTYHICFIWFWGGGCLFKHPFSDMGRHRSSRRQRGAGGGRWNTWKSNALGGGDLCPSLGAFPELLRRWLGGH